MLMTHNLTVPDIYSHTIPQELQHISDWASRHNFKLNQTKSREMILRLQKTSVSTPIYLSRVESLTVYAVFQKNMWPHFWW